MLYIFIIFIVLSLYKISFNKINQIDEEALSHSRTTMINGFFVGLILFSHFNSYVSLSSSTDKIYLMIMRNIAQLMVTTFLFYSGYGIYESIKNKPKYMENFFKNRLVKLFISFSLAIILYIIMNLILKNSYPVTTILLSFIGIKDIGNSNWFIFATFCMYISILISFKIFKKNHQTALLSCLLGTILYIFILRKFGYSGYWYDTVLCFNLGMYVSYYKKNILKLLKDKWNYIVVLITIFLMFLMTHIKGYNYIVYILHSLIFVLIVLVITLKVKFGNKLLYYLGKNTFNIYVLQRLAYMALNKISYFSNHICAYFLVSIIIIIILTYIFDIIVKFTHKLLKLV